MACVVQVTLVALVVVVDATFDSSSVWWKIVNFVVVLVGKAFVVLVYSTTFVFPCNHNRTWMVVRHLILLSDCVRSFLVFVVVMIPTDCCCFVSFHHQRFVVTVRPF